MRRLFLCDDLQRSRRVIEAFGTLDVELLALIVIAAAIGAVVFIAHGLSR